MTREDTFDGKDTAYDLDEGALNLPGILFRYLPDCLQNVIQLLPGRTDKDLFLTGALPVIAGAMPNIRLRYGGLWQSLNLFLCVVANPGAGKGKLRLARALGDVLNRYLHDVSQNEIAYWENRLESGNDCGMRPDFHRLFLAGDSSAAALKENLAVNPNAVIFETEIATMTAVLKQEWGQFRDVLLKSFHNEPVSVDRKGADPLLIDHPALSVVLSGTPHSFREIISDLEDGLFSRMCFYTFEGADDFVDQFGGDVDEEIDQQIEKIGELLKSIYSELMSRTDPLYLIFDDELKALVNRAGKDATLHLHRASAPGALRANVNRAAFVACRIAGVLTLLRLAKQGVSLAGAKSITADRNSLNAGLLIAFGFLDHAFRLAPLIAATGRKILRTPEQRYLDALPYGEFDTEIANDIANKLNINMRTAGRYRNKFVAKGVLKDEGYGKWSRPQNAARVLFDLSVVSDILLEELEGESEDLHIVEQVDGAVLQSTSDAAIPLRHLDTRR